MEERTGRAAARRQSKGSAPLGAPRKFDDEAVKRIAALHGQGLSSVRIAEALGCSKSTVIRLLHRQSDASLPLGAPRKYDDAAVERIAALREEGFSTWQIAEAVGCSQRTVMRLLERKYLRTAPEAPDAPGTETASRAAALYDAGLPVPQIADELGVSQSTARRLLSR